MNHCWERRLDEYASADIPLNNRINTEMRKQKFRKSDVCVYSIIMSTDELIIITLLWYMIIKYIWDCLSESMTHTLAY